MAINKENLGLIFINSIGTTWDGNSMYEFLFTSDINNIKDGEEWYWDLTPASGKPIPPSKEYVNAVAKITTDLNLDLIQDSDTFAFWDAVDGIVALGWENLSGYDAYPESRLVFRYGESYQSIEDKLYNKDITIESNIKKNEKTRN